MILFFLIMGAGLIVLSFLDLAFGSKNLSFHACKCDCVDFFLLGSVISLHAWGKLFDSLNNTGRPACYNYFSFREFFFFVIRYNTCLFTLLRIFHFSWKSFRKITYKKNCWKLCLLVKAEAFYKYWHLMGKGHFFFFFFVYFGLPSFLGHWNTWILRCLCGLTCLFFYKKKKVWNLNYVVVFACLVSELYVEWTIEACIGFSDLPFFPWSNG